jgi:DnaJ family protein B protein 12
MIANKEEAERCIEYAERFILDGKKDKAEKILLKAERLFPTQKAKGKLRLLIFHVCTAYQNKDSK